MNYHAGTYDVIVIGAGHEVLKQRLLLHDLAVKQLFLLINMDAVGNCPCNPSIGGIAKGHFGT